MCLTGVLIGTYTGTFTVAGPIIQAFAIDLGLQTSQIANRSAIYAIEPKARNRVNTAFMVSVFCGQLIGTAVGNRLYAQGGWVASGSASVGFICAALLVCFARAPWESHWLGWRGGWGIRRRDLPPKRDSSDEENVHVRDGEVQTEEEEEARETALGQEDGEMQPREFDVGNEEKRDLPLKSEKVEASVDKASETDIIDEKEKAIRAGVAE
jgi:hypothetical protein